MVLLVVDTQKLIVKPELYEFQVFEQNVKNLIRVARENQIEVIYVQHDDGPGEELTKGVAGYEIYDEFKPEEGEAIFAKNETNISVSAVKGTTSPEFGSIAFII